MFSVIFNSVNNAHNPVSFNPFYKLITLRIKTTFNGVK